MIERVRVCFAIKNIHMINKNEDGVREKEMNRIGFCLVFVLLN